jgi:roadblock/LC7 domain-containing protein
MARLDDLLKIDGAVAAGEFAPDGTLVDFKSSMNMSRDLAAATAQFCATVSMLFNTLAGAHSQLSGMRWLPQQGWAYSGGDMTVAVGGRYGIFIKTEKADFNQLFQVLVGQSARAAART